MSEDLRSLTQSSLRVELLKDGFSERFINELAMAANRDNYGQTTDLQGLVGEEHGLSQQGVWVLFWTPKPLKRTPQDTQIFLCGISKNLFLKLIIEFFHILIIPMTLFNNIMPYFDEFIQVYG